MMTNQRPLSRTRYGKPLHPKLRRANNRQLLDAPAQLVFNQHPQPMWVFDRETLAFVDVNEAAVRRYGYSRDEFLSMKITDIRPPEDVESFLERMRDTTVEYSTDTHWRHRLKDGTIVPVRITAHRFQHRGRLLNLVVVDDESSYVETANNLNILQTFVTQAEEAVEMGFWLIRDGLHPDVPIYWSRNMFTLYGVSALDFMPTVSSVHALVHPDDRDWVYSLYEAMDSRGVIEPYDHRIVRPNGDIRWLHVRSRMIHPPGADQPQIIGFVMDVTERKQLETSTFEQARLRLALEHEITLRQAQERFLSMVSHEFRAPLASIRMAVDMLQTYHDRLTPDGRQDRYIRIQQQIDALTALINDLLTLLRFQAAGMVEQAEEVDLRRLCIDIAADQQTDATLIGQKPRVLVAVPAAPVYVQGSARILRRAFDNLVSNALKYSPIDQPVQIHLTCDYDDLSALLHVIDYGIGIPPAEQPKLFEPFFRASNVGDTPGTGLGLPIASEAIQRHGGAISVDSAPGRGTTFIVRLPLLEAS